MSFPPDTHRRRLTILLATALGLTVAAMLLASGGGSPALSQEVGLDDPPEWLAASKQYQRWRWAFDQRAYPLGYVPRGARDRAVADLQRLRASGPPGMAGSRWESIGPTPIDSRLDDRFVDKMTHSGRVADVAIDPKRKRHWLIAGAQGGIWETKNKGRTWTARTDTQTTLAMGAIAFGPRRNRIVYAGTGEAVFSGDTYGGTGVLKSTNGGRTWRQVNRTDLDGLAFSDIAVDPGDDDTVVAATVRGVVRRTFVLLQAGIFRSTDGGRTWQRTLDGQATDLEIDPTDFDVQYAGLGEVFGQAQNGLYRSTDAGQTWQPVAGPWDGRDPGRMELAMAPTDPDVLYVSVHDPDSGGLLGLWKTEDASSAAPAWNQVRIDPQQNNDVYCGTQCWYDHELLVDRRDPDTLYAGGVWLWKLEDGQWSEILPGHVDQHSLAWAGNMLVVGNDGGVFSSEDDRRWKSHNDDLTLTQFYAGDVHPRQPDHVLGASQDNGTQVRESGRGPAADQWRRFFGGDGAGLAIADDDPDNSWAFSSQRLNLMRTRDAGRSVQRVNDGINTDAAAFIAPVAKCPADDDVFLAGTDRAWRSDNFFSAPSPRWKDQGPRLGDTEIRALAFSPADGRCKIAALGTADGQIWVTKNGRKWRDADKRGQVPDRAITGLAWDPEDKDVLWVTVSGFDQGTPRSPGHVFLTSNARKARPRWRNVDTGLDLPHNSIAIQPGNTPKAWVATDLGVFEQATFGNRVRWAQHGTAEGLPNVAIHDIRAREDGVVAFTHGRGAFLLRQ